MVVAAAERISGESAADSNSDSAVASNVAQQSEALWDWAALAKCFARVNNSLRRVHEHVSPKYTLRERIAFGINDEYGGITGTLTPGCFVTVAKCLAGLAVGKPLRKDSQEGFCALNEQFHLRQGESVFCDVGSGTGRPSFYFGCLALRASVGFDIDPMQVFNSCNGKRLLMEDMASPINSSVLFQVGDVGALDHICPCTHVFAFLGYTEVIKKTALLIARSESVKVLVATVLHQGELDCTGLLEEDPENPIIKLPGMKMTGGNSYMSLVIPMTRTRRKNVFRTLKQGKTTIRLRSKGGLSTKSTPFFEPSLDAIIESDESYLIHQEKLYQDLLKECFPRTRCMSSQMRDSRAGSAPPSLERRRKSPQRGKIKARLESQNEGTERAVSSPKRSRLGRR